jgi:hypothetical protein
MPQKIGWVLDQFLFCHGNPVQHDECCATSFLVIEAGSERLDKKDRVDLK